MTRLATIKTEKKEALPDDPKADVKIIDSAVSARCNYEDLKKKKFDSQAALNSDCNGVDSTECPDQDYATLSKQYVEADYHYQVAKADEGDRANTVKELEESIDAKTFATITTCDAKDGIVHKEYDEANCDGTPVTTFKAQWGACVQAPDAKNFIKVTGAAALQAAAVAVVAFAGSQF